MPTPSIRVAHEADVTELAVLRRLYAEEQKGVVADLDAGFSERFREWHHNTTDVSRWWVADAGQAIVGLAHMFVHFRMPMPTHDSGGWGYLSLLYVRPEHRGRGLGAQLLGAAEDEAIRLGFSKVLLNPTEKASPLYHRCGYEVAGSYLVHNLSSSA